MSITPSTEAFKNAYIKRKETGCSKEYLNRLRQRGCPRSQCSLCRLHPVDKSKSKTKGFNKYNSQTLRFYIE
jgi:hypothetical protein